MKRWVISLILVVLFNLLFCASGMAGRKFTDVGSHRHDFSAGSGLLQSTNEEGICVFCHTPHGGSVDTPLWNRQDPSGGPFPLYGQPANIRIDEIPSAQYDGTDYPNGSTKLCLSCHDGVSSVTAILNPSNMTVGPILMGSDNLTDYNSTGISDNPNGMIVNLAISHPVSFVYDASVLAALDGFYGPGIYSLPTGPNVKLDAADRMQCTTCHDPHDDTRQGGYPYPFWANYTGASPGDYDDTCQRCHTGTPLGNTHNM